MGTTLTTLRRCQRIRALDLAGAFLLSFTVLASNLNAACYTRHYSEDHLNRYPNQQIRSVMLSVESFHAKQLDYLPGSEEEYSYFYPFHLKIDLKRDGKSLTGEAQGYCQANLYPIVPVEKVKCFITEKEQVTGEFYVDDAKNPNGSEMGYWKLLTFSEETPLRVNGQAAPILLPQFDFKSRVGDTQSLLTGMGGSADHFAFEKGCPKILFETDSTITRQINETALSLVRLSLARPTVTARNLYHLSALLWDIYASFNGQAEKTLFVYRQPEIVTNAVNLENVLGFAAFHFLSHRYEREPGNAAIRNDLVPWGEERIGDIDWVLQKFLEMRNLKVSSYPKTNALGKEFADALIAKTLNDGSREPTNYDPDPSYQLINNNPALHINLSGIASPAPFEPHPEYEFNVFNWRSGGIPFSDQLDIDYWNPLYVPGAADQNGNDQDFAQSPLTLHWGSVPTFADLSAYYDEARQIYFNPESHLPLWDQDKEDLILQNLDVARASLWHNPIEDGTYHINFGGGESHEVTIAESYPGSKKIDISPKSMGNNSLGTNDGKGYGSEAFDPKTGAMYQYEPYMVKAADYYRSIAEFWADGPASETPPGHWNTIANYAIDQMKAHNIGFRWEGEGLSLSQMEFELRTYLTLNGALHDAGVVAWGIKGAFQGGRPITVIRKLAAMAETDSQFAQYLVELSDGLLKMEKADFEVSLGHFDANDKCNAMLLFNETDEFYPAVYASLKDKYRKLQEEMVFESRPSEYGDGFICYAVFSEEKLWIHSWLGQDAFETPDGSFKIRPILQGPEKLKRDVFAMEQVAGTGYMLAENWVTYQKLSFVTPPFPGFVSGHSTFSRAAAEVLAFATGTKFFPGGLGSYKAPALEFEGKSDESPFEFKWATYFDASDQSGISRIFGGIHAAYDDLPARRIGSKVGIAATKKVRKLFSK